MAPTDHGDAVLVALESGETYRIQVVRRPLPRGSGMALFYRCPWCRVEDAGARLAARRAAVALVEAPAAQLVPVSLDQQGAAPVAARRLPRDVVDVAGVGVADAVGQSDVARAGESRRRRGRPILELPVWMER